MQELAEIARILTQAGYIVKDCQLGFICIVDPTCIWPPLMDFIKNAWIVLTTITGVLLAGWAAVLLRGAKNDYAKKFKSFGFNVWYFIIGIARCRFFRRRKVCYQPM